MLRSEVSRIAAIAVVMGIGVVMRIHRRHVVRVTRTRMWYRTIAIVVVAIRTRAMVVTWARSDVDDHPRLVAIAVPEKAYRLEVFKGGEAEQLVIELVVRHHRISPCEIQTAGRNSDRNSSDATRAYSHILRAIAITVIGIEIDIEIATISVVSDILDIIVDSYRIGIVGQHGL